MKWPVVTIGSLRSAAPNSLVGGPFGSDLTAKDYVESGVPVIRGTNLSNEAGFSGEDFVFVSDSKADLLRANNAFRGDLIFTQRGTLGQVGLIPRDSTYDRYVVSQSQMKLTVDTQRVDSKFVYYFFRSPATVQNVKNRAITSGVPHINLGILRDFTIPLPPLEIQKNITILLQGYDDLIENNRRRMQLLEESARLLYKEWFVHLRFPGHEHVKLTAGVPQGWAKTTIGALGEIITGKTPSTKDESNFGFEVPFIKTPDMHRQTLIVETEQSLSERGAQLQPKKLLPRGSILVSCIGTVGVVSITTRPSQTNQQINSIIPSWNDLRYYSYFALTALKLRLEAMGGGATMPNVSKTKFGNVPLLLPIASLLSSFQEIAEPIFSQIENLLILNTKLTRARDLLLPRLMSGELVA